MLSALKLRPSPNGAVLDSQTWQHFCESLKLEDLHFVLTEFAVDVSVNPDFD